MKSINYQDFIDHIDYGTYEIIDSQIDEAVRNYTHFKSENNYHLSVGVDDYFCANYSSDIENDDLMCDVFNAIVDGINEEVERRRTNDK